MTLIEMAVHLQRLAALRWEIAADFKETVGQHLPHTVRKRLDVESDAMYAAARLLYEIHAANAEHLVHQLLDIVEHHPDVETWAMVPADEHEAMVHRLVDLEDDRDLDADLAQAIAGITHFKAAAAANGFDLGTTVPR